MFKNINLQEKLINVRAKELQNLDILDWVGNVLEDLEQKRALTLKELNSSEGNSVNVFNFDLLDCHSIFSKNQIKKICVNYRLRFLDTVYFKGDYPEELITKVQHLEKIHNTKLESFKIVAPSVLFRLRKSDDPMLFVPMGNDYYYLIHKWGNDLHPMRKLKYWAVKNVGNFAFTLTLMSFIFTILTHTFFFRDKSSIVYFILLFLFYFKGAVGFGLYFGIASGKNFSEYAWLSKYDKLT